MSNQALDFVLEFDVVPFNCPLTLVKHKSENICFWATQKATETT